MKIEIPELKDKAHPDEFIDWLNTVERVFDLKDFTESEKVKLVAIKLQQHASIWWEHVKKQRAKEGKWKITTWDKMRKLLRQKFLLEHYRQEAFIEYHGIKQRAIELQTPQEVWSGAAGDYSSFDRTKAIRVLHMRGDFSNLMMKESELVKDFISKLMEVVNRMKIYGKMFKDKEVEEKILIIIPEKFDSKIVAIEESRDLSTLTVTELISSFKVHEK
ncbi:UBN2 domain-containing protein, partial [Cephalotus follicularis]